LHKLYPNAQIVITGCLSERKPQEIAQMEGVTHVVPNQEKEHLIKQLFPEEELPEFKIDQFSAHTRAFVKVQDGCNSFCTYCIIPYVRGRSRSRALSSIIKEVEGLVGQGYKEVVLTGINIGDYEGEEGQRLGQLVKAVDQVPGIERIRISSIDPDEVDEELMEAVLYGRNTCHSLHIVLQSGSNLILKRMNRKYTKQIFLETIHKLRKISPQFTFTTDIIVGFPGETESDFQETLDVMQEVQFAKVHMFPYSVRERTRAALYPNRIPQDTIEKRKQRVLRESERFAYLLREKYVGLTMKVLVETENPCFGHSEHFLPVYLNTHCPRNSIVMVEAVSNTPEGLQVRVLT
jgi:threonylcarbamoyladenosine tRNA methylthiotransferase MtaB